LDQLNLKRLTLSVSDPGLRRVSVHAGTVVVDLALPSGMPVATLIPPIVDTLEAHGISGVMARYQLSVLGSAALDSSMTLAQSGIRDGDVLVLSEFRAPSPALRYDDLAEAVSGTLGGQAWSASRNRLATRLTAAVAAGCLTGIGGLALVRNTLTANAVRGLPTAGIAALVALVAMLSAALAGRAYRDAMVGLTLSLVATTFAAIAGFLAVPGIPGLPSALLAAAAAAVTATLAMHISGCGTVTLTAVSCFAMVVGVAAFTGVVSGASLHVVSPLLALVSLGLLQVAARTAVFLAGLSPKPTNQSAVADCLVTKALRADAWLTSLLAAFSSSAAVGAIVTVSVGTPRFGCTAFAAITGVLLLLRANPIDKKGMLVGAISAVAVIGTTFGSVALGAPAHGPWIAAATVLLVAGAVYVGFVTPEVSLAPFARKGIELLECVVLIAMVPLTCWLCGFYGAVRALHPRWS
jgi:type VII secretion integral membrane protein EccD